MKKNYLAIKLLLGALIGWMGAYLLMKIIFKGNYFIDFEFDLFLSLAPGVVIGLLVVHMLNKNSSSNETPINQTSVAEQIARLKQLLDNGILTTEEFNTQKSVILGYKVEDKPTSVASPQPNDTSVPKEKSISEKLIELKALLDTNAVSEKEYETIKQDLLKKL